MAQLRTKSATGKPTPDQLRQAERMCREYISRGELTQNETYSHIRGGYMSGYNFHNAEVAYNGSVEEFNAYIDRVDKKIKDWEVARPILERIRSEVFGLPLSSTTIVKLLDIKDEEIPKKPK